MALHIKYFPYDSREFPPENHLLHAFVSSLPVILASYNRRVVKLLSHVDNWHICAKAVQSLSFLTIIFYSGPMVICIQEDVCVLIANRSSYKIICHSSQERSNARWGGGEGARLHSTFSHRLTKSENIM